MSWSVRELCARVSNALSLSKQGLGGVWSPLALVPSRGTHPCISTRCLATSPCRVLPRAGLSALELHKCGSLDGADDDLESLEGKPQQPYPFDF